MTLEAQLDQIKVNDVEREAASEAWRNQLYSEDFLTATAIFGKLTSKLEGHAITLKEASAGAITPITPALQGNISGQPQQGASYQTNPTEYAVSKGAETKHMYARVAVAIAVCVMCGLLALVQVPTNMVAANPNSTTTVLPNGTMLTTSDVTVTSRGVLPVTWFIAIIAGTLVLLFGYDYLRSFLNNLEKKNEPKELTSGIQSLEWIHEQFDWVRQRYTSVVFSPEERKDYFKATLPTDFLSRIDRVLISCRTDSWRMKEILIQAIARREPAGAGT